MTLRYAQTWAELAGKQIFTAYDAAGYCYGVYAADYKAKLVNELPAGLRIKRSTRAILSEPAECEILI